LTNSPVVEVKEELFRVEEPFNIEKLIQYEKEKVVKQEPNVIEKRNHEKFQEICEVVSDALRDIIITDGEKEKSDEWLDRQHLAVIGNEEAMRYFIEKIQNVIRDKNISFTDFPYYFSNLAEAIFHEVWGVSVLAKWERSKSSEAAVIHGTNLWIDYGDGKGFELQRETFDSPETVERVKRTFIHRKEDSVLNRESPELEIEREDGSRISMIQAPRSKDDYVMIRRFVVDRFTLEDQAKRDTIPKEDIPIYRALSRTMANMIVAGRVRSAKSTFLKTLAGERPENYVHVILEKHFELAFGKHFPKRLSYEFQAKEGDLERVIPSILRMEHDSIIVGEIRSLEIEAYLQSTERGERGALSTYHLTDVHRVIRQLTNHALDAKPNRRYEVELERVANAVDIVITMGTDRDRKKKRVTGVAEVVWDEASLTHYVHELIKFNPINKKYYYSANISPRLLKLMADENLEETQLLIQTLKKQSEISPMENLIEEQLETIVGVN
jgi:pilus assembly protein CpaF